MLLWPWDFGFPRTHPDYCPWFDKVSKVLYVWSMQDEKVISHGLETLFSFSLCPQTPSSLEMLPARYNRSSRASSVHLRASAALTECQFSAPILFRVRVRVRKWWLFQAESSLCADKLIICFTLSEQWVSLSSLPDHLCFITRHLDDKGNLGVKVNLEMTQGFGFLSVTQAWKTQLVPVTQGRGSQAWGWSRTLFSRGWFASRLCGVTF